MLFFTVKLLPCFQTKLLNVFVLFHKDKPGFIFLDILQVQKLQILAFGVILDRKRIQWSYLPGSNIAETDFFMF